MSGDISGCYSWGRGLLASSGQRPGLLLNIPQCTGWTTVHGMDHGAQGGPRCSGVDHGARGGPRGTGWTTVLHGAQDGPQCVGWTTVRRMDHGARDGPR